MATSASSKMDNTITKWLIPEESLEQLRCWNCKLYLSHFPIHFYPGKGNICGRCPLPQNRRLERNQTYETLAAVNLFPCRYNKSGCTEIHTPSELSDHEEMCGFRQYECVALTKESCCTWKGLDCHFHLHFKRTHSGLVVSEDGFKVDFSGELNDNYLVTHEDKNFVVKLRSFVGKTVVKISVELIGAKCEAEDYMYEVKMENEKIAGSEFTFEKQQVNGFSGKLDLNSVVEFKKSFIQEELKDLKDITCKVIIYNRDNFLDLSESMKVTPNSFPSEDVNQAIYDLLKCGVCSTKLIPPIYVFIGTLASATGYCRHGNGTSVCEVCSNRDKYCKICKIDVQGVYVRNTYLERVTEKLLHYCRYRAYDCPFYNNKNALLTHEKDCDFKPHSCPIIESECNWKGKLMNFMEHMKQNHKQYILYTGCVSIPAKDKYNEHFVLESHGRIFLVFFTTIIKYGTDLFGWNVAPLGKVENGVSFSCLIDFVDTKVISRQHRLVFKVPCNSNSCKIHSDLLKSIIGDRLVCRIRIVKNR